jgi:hypothetical protein
MVDGTRVCGSSWIGVHYSQAPGQDKGQSPLLEDEHNSPHKRASSRVEPRIPCAMEERLWLSHPNFLRLP